MEIEQFKREVKLMSDSMNLYQSAYDERKEALKAEFDMRYEEMKQQLKEFSDKTGIKSELMYHDGWYVSSQLFTRE